MLFFLFLVFSIKVHAKYTTLRLATSCCTQRKLSYKLTQVVVLLLKINIFFDASCRTVVRLEYDGTTVRQIFGTTTLSYFLIFLWFFFKFSPKMAEILLVIEKSRNTRHESHRKTFFKAPKTVLQILFHFLQYRMNFYRFFAPIYTISHRKNEF